MTTAIKTGFGQRCEWLSLSALTLCFFVSSLSVTLTTVTYLLAFVLLLFSCNWRERFLRIKHNKAAWSFWLLGALFLFGLIYTTSTSHLAFHDLQKRHWLFMTPFFMMIIVQERWRQRMVNAFLLAVVITLILSYLKWFHVNIDHWMPIKNPPSQRADVFMDYIIQSFAMNIAAFICGYRTLFDKKWRVIYAALFVLMAINVVFMSHGRVGYVIFFLLIAYLFFIRFGWKGLLSALLLVIVLIGLASVFSSNFRYRMKEVYVNYQHYGQTTKSTSVGQRLEMYSIAKTMIAKRPWFGYGTGGIRTAMQKMIPAKDRFLNPKMDYVESIYLNFLLEFGVFGFIILLGALSMQISVTFHLPREYRHLMQAFLLAYLGGGLINAFFVSFPLAHFYALFSALCFSSLPQLNDDKLIET